MDESWDLLQKDVSKLGDGFQDFADKFYVILVSWVLQLAEMSLNSISECHVTKLIQLAYARSTI